jgi:hypothetical protein
MRPKTRGNSLHGHDTQHLHPDPSPTISDFKKGPPGIRHTNGNNAQTYQITFVNKNECSAHPKAFKKKTSSNQQNLNPLLSTEELLHLVRKHLL